jgi:hypothetical protein
VAAMLRKKKTLGAHKLIEQCMKSMKVYVKIPKDDCYLTRSRKKNQTITTSHYEPILPARTKRKAQPKKKDDNPSLRKGQHQKHADLNVH